MALSAIRHRRIDNSGFDLQQIPEDRGHRKAQKEKVP
jgi:hypothetical protein